MPIWAPIAGRNREHTSATGRRTYMHVRATNQSVTTLYRIARNITPPAQQMAEMLLVTEIITRCIFIVTLCLKSVAAARLSACEIHLSCVPRRQDLSVASKVLKPFANYATAIINHTTSTVWHCKNDLLKPDVILGIFVEKIQQRPVIGLDERERMEREKRNWRKTRLVSI